MFKSNEHGITGQAQNSLRTSHVEFTRSGWRQFFKLNRSLGTRFIRGFVLRYATKEGKSITRQTGEVEWTAIRRTHDNQYQAVADEDENGFTAAKGATFLQSVYEPVFATGG